MLFAYLLQPSEKWRDAIKFCLFMFCFLPPRKCASCTFSEATAAISAISAFSTHLAAALCSRLLQEAGLDPFHISSSPLLRSQRITRCPIIRKKCGGECTRDSSSEFSWEISKRSVALQSGSQSMRILSNSLLETVFEKRGTLNWIEPLLAQELWESLNGLKIQLAEGRLISGLNLISKF